MKHPLKFKTNFCGFELCVCTAWSVIADPQADQGSLRDLTRFAKKKKSNMSLEENVFC